MAGTLRTGSACRAARMLRSGTQQPKDATANLDMKRELTRNVDQNADLAKHGIPVVVPAWRDGSGMVASADNALPVQSSMTRKPPASVKISTNSSLWTSWLAKPALPTLPPAPTRPPVCAFLDSLHPMVSAFESALTLKSKMARAAVLANLASSETIRGFVSQDALLKSHGMDPTVTALKAMLDTEEFAGSALQAQSPTTRTLPAFARISTNSSPLISLPAKLARLTPHQMPIRLLVCVFLDSLHPMEPASESALIPKFKTVKVAAHANLAS